MRPTHHDEIPTRYYPPRARWYSPALQCWFDVRRALRLEKIHPPANLTWRDFLLALAVPGHAFSAFGMRLAGRLILAAFAVELLIFLVALGYAAANVAFSLMLSSHATSIIYLAGRLAGAPRLWVRLLFAVVTLLVLSLLVYLPLRRVLETFFVPLRLGDRIVVIKRMSAPKSVQRGAVVAYRIDTRSQGEVRIKAGTGLDPILAVGGDQVRFLRDGFEVNGEKFPRRPDMPLVGELVVPEKHWFVWPRFAINNQHLPVNRNSGLLLQMAIISETQYLGQPYHHWFGRRQNLSPTP